MNLTPEESAALERLRRVNNGETYNEVYDNSVSTALSQRLDTLAMECKRLHREDKYVAARTILRLFPVRQIGDVVIRWDDPVTPERLLACGWSDRDDRGLRIRAFNLYAVEWYGEVKLWIWNGVAVSPEHEPQNMLDIWTLMERAGVEIPGEVM